MRSEHPCIPSPHPCVSSGEQEHPPPDEPSGWARILAQDWGVYPGMGPGWAACRRAGMGSHIPGRLALLGQTMGNGTTYCGHFEPREIACLSFPICMPRWMR